MNSLNSDNLILRRAITAASVIIVSPIIFFLNNFGDWYISSDQAKWGQLGDFMNVWVSIANLILVGTLTYYLNELQIQREQEYRKMEATRLKTSEENEKNRDELIRQREEQLNRPYVIFRREPSGLYILKNIGNGPALNITWAQMRDDVWLNEHITFPLGSGESRNIEREMASNDIIGIEYNDIFNKDYSTIYVHGVTEFFQDTGIYQQNRTVQRNEILRGVQERIQNAVFSSSFSRSST